MNIVRRVLPGLWSEPALKDAYAITRRYGIAASLTTMATWLLLRIAASPTPDVVAPFAMSLGWLSACLGSSFLIDARRGVLMAGRNPKAVLLHMIMGMSLLGGLLLVFGISMMGFILLALARIGS